jgi:hypothetical protein
VHLVLTMRTKAQRKNKGRVNKLLCSKKTTNYYLR